MIWISCPVCKGDGKNIRHDNNICHVCSGQGIINELSGRPPESKIITSTTTNWKMPLTSVESKEFKEDKSSSTIEGFKSMLEGMFGEGNVDIVILDDLEGYETDDEPSIEDIMKAINKEDKNKGNVN